MYKTSTELSPPIYYTIYMVTNLVNGKIYVGKHQTSNLEDGYLGSGKWVKRAVKKYGRDSFRKEILFIFDDAERMDAKEREIVTEEFCIRTDTYNLCVGGLGGWSYVNREGINNAGKDMAAISAKVSAALTGRPNEATSRRMKEWHRQGLVTIPRHDAGWKHSEETKGKMRGTKNVGDENPQFGTMWVHLGKEERKIRAENLAEYISNGYSRGRQKTRLSLKCGCCGEIFEVKPHKSDRRFCSRKCYGETNRNPEGLSARELNTLSKRREREKKKAAAVIRSRDNGPSIGPGLPPGHLPEVR